MTAMKFCRDSRCSKLYFLRVYPGAGQKAALLLIALPPAPLQKGRSEDTTLERRCYVLLGDVLVPVVYCLCFAAIVLTQKEM